MNLDAIEKGGYDFFMLKEIMEQPVSTANCLRGRLLVDNGRVRLGGIQTTMWQDRPIVDWLLQLSVYSRMNVGLEASFVSKCIVTIRYFHCESFSL